MSALLSLSNFSVSVPGFKLGPLTMEIHPGELWFILGENGAGKSTLLRSIVSLQEFDQHSGGLFMRTDLRISLLTNDEPAPFPISVLDMVRLGRLAFGETSEDHPSVRAAIEFTEIIDFLNRDIRSLSSGERQRVRLARALARDPHVLLLDEGLAHLDLAIELSITKKLKEWVSSKERAILLVTHDLSLGQEISSHILLLKSGQEVAYGRTNETLNSANFLRAFPGVNLKEKVILSPSS